ncbi:MAG TPA: CHASE3 domain-containing protein [Caulobacteraceae bacterium]|nr:CHASE3 domain-containing protein [Caulobacteraceae bacterium]
MGFKRIVAAAVALALLVAGLSVFLIFTQVATVASARAWLDHTRAVIDSNQQLLASVQELEDSERGFVITHDPAYLKGYHRASASLPTQEAELRRLVADNPAEARQVADLIDAIQRRQSTVDRIVAAGQAGDFELARDVMVGSRAHVEMEDIRALADKVTTSENTLLNSRTIAARQIQNLELVLGLAVSLVALTGLTLGMILLADNNRRLVRAIASAETAEAARDALSALTTALFNASPDYLIVLNIEDGDRYVVADLNPAFAKTLNVRPERVRGRAVERLLPPRVAAGLIAHYRDVRAGGEPITTRSEIPGLPGGPRVWESIMAPVRNADGVVDRLIGAVRDITDRVRAEERLRDSQRMEAIGQLTGGVAHDFNNLLQVIRGNLELLASMVEGDPRGQTRLKNALYGADRAAQLTRQLLAFARRQPLAPKVVNLSRLVSDMADLLRRTLGEAIEVETVVAGGLWNTIADPAQVESAILNLALNARDAMPNGGRLTVEITNAALDETYARTARDVTPGQYVMIAVTDTGEGMTDEVRARVFEPFFTTKSDGKGTGLGLSMVYGFVKQSNGHIQIYSEVAHGTTVKIYLPRSRQAEQRTLLLLDQPPAPETGQTILVVEDEDAVREAAVGMLDELGYRSLQAPDAEAALKLVEAGERIDLVFTDVVMPGAIRTRDFAHRVQAMRPGVPILFTSGYTDNAIIHQGRLDDGVHLISKPYAKADLARRIAQLIAEPSAAP